MHNLKVRTLSDRDYNNQKILQLFTRHIEQQHRSQNQTLAKTPDEWVSMKGALKNALRHYVSALQSSHEIVRAIIVEHNKIPIGLLIGGIQKGTILSLYDYTAYVRALYVNSSKKNDTSSAYKVLITSFSDWARNKRKNIILSVQIDNYSRDIELELGKCGLAPEIISYSKRL